MERHARQAVLPEVGDVGQARLRRARVLVVGLGGLGAPASQYLAGAGVGTLGLLDPDVVDATNLHRQPLYAAADVGRPKADAAAGRLRALDPATVLLPMRARLEAGNAAAFVRGWDVVLGCTDDEAARYALSDACARAGIPLVHGAVSRWDGACTVFAPGGPCYRCLHPRPAEGAATCATEGVMGTVPGLVGLLQAQEALKLLLGAGQSLAGRVLLVDGLGGATRTIALKRRDGCHCAVENPACPMPWNTPSAPAITLQEYEARKGEFFLLDVREVYEHEEAAMPGSTLIPLGELPGRLGEVPSDRPIACLCAVGGRSARAAALLNERGYQAFNLLGGMRAWLAMQGPAFRQ